MFLFHVRSRLLLHYLPANETQNCLILRTLHWCCSVLFEDRHVVLPSPGSYIMKGISFLIMSPENYCCRLIGLPDAEQPLSVSSPMSVTLLSLSCQKEGRVRWLLHTDAATRTALKSGRKQWSVPVSLGKWQEPRETDLPVWMVSGWPDSQCAHLCFHSTW